MKLQQKRKSAGRVYSSGAFIDSYGYFLFRQFTDGLSDIAKWISLIGVKTFVL